ncbi:bifunctional adenosylcobinamide kinase/adenosylcobinamide-phosphate guanylyltransferase [Paenibacillus piri]|uniref:Adenosylcobinamide kinase n=1 Tax=Paenibacillus piri TaxID=2547395 RepID=A0A4R5KYX4_9BACL|nr:bifunctional adenosylcobinamide kinase/adenosylcobinamide-phosphate guanylyltransferase [Paenibacillus piri]TDG00436.1 bifunctional adenosylcobinamide kinase/adenosylcobinamide-phosphate guanylyltransferase [Paenibacillus piri]
MLILVTGGARSGKSSFAEAYCAKLGQRGVYIATAQAYDEEMKARIRLHQRQRENGGLHWTTVEEPYALADMLQRLYRLQGVHPGQQHLDGLQERQRLQRDGEQPAEDRWIQEQPEHIERERQPSESGHGQPASGQPERAQPEHEAPDPEKYEGRMHRDDLPVVLVDCLTLWLSNWLLKHERQADAEGQVQPLLDELKRAASLFAADRRRHLVFVTNEVGYGLVPEYKLGRQFRDLSGRMNQQLAQEADEVFLVTAGIPVELKRIRFEL